MSITAEIGKVGSEGEEMRARARAVVRNYTACAECMREWWCCFIRPR